MPESDYELLNDNYEDARFKRVKIFIAHTGENLNHTSFSRESLITLSKTLSYVPIVGYIKENDNYEEDFAGREQRITIENNGITIDYLGVPFGFIPEVHNARMEVRDGKEWLVAEGYLWTKFKKSIDLFDNSDGRKSQSMEIEDVVGTVDDEGVLHISEASFSALCILGDEVLPAMSGSTIEYFSKNNDMKHLIEEMLVEFSTKEDKMSKEELKSFEEEAKETPENEKEVKDEAVSSEEIEVIEKDSVKEDLEIPEGSGDAEGKKEEDIKKAEESEGDEPVEAEKSDGSGSLGQDGSTVDIVSDNDGTGGQTTEGVTGTDVGAPDTTTTPTLTPTPDTTTTADTNFELEEANNKIAQLEKEISELREYKVEVERKEKTEMLDSYAKELSDNAINTLKESMDSMSINDFEKEIAYTIFKSEKEQEATTAKAFSYGIDFSKDDNSDEFSSLKQYL